MCNCASCDTTDRYSGLPDLFGDIPWIIPAPHEANGHHVMGFNAWPRGEPAGAVSSAKEYKAHQAHCGSAGLPKPWRFVPGKAPQFNTAGLVMPIKQAPQFVLDYIASMPTPKWEAPKPKPVPRLVALARELRKAA